MKYYNMQYNQNLYILIQSHTHRTWVSFQELLTNIHGRISTVDKVSRLTYILYMCVGITSQMR